MWELLQIRVLQLNFENVGTHTNESDLFENEIKPDIKLENPSKTNSPFKKLNIIFYSFSEVPLLLLPVKKPILFRKTSVCW